MEIAILGLFCSGLIGCIAMDLSILYALFFGLALFLFYAYRQGFRGRELLRMTLTGVKKVKNILITFVLIGMLTAIWRRAGTIAVIVCWASGLIRPSVFLMMSFLLNCLVSVLTGTSFGTSATMGVICAAMGRAMGVSPVLTGGTVLAGAYFGDRCSPVSTSALLVSELTHTSIFDNIRNMVRTALIPFLLSCVIYSVVGFCTVKSGEVPELREIFEREFTLHWAAVLPAALILLLSAMKVKVKLAMSLSILAAIPVCIFIQNSGPVSLIPLFLNGFHADNPQVASMLNGGGIFSMAKVAAIVCISSSFSGIFEKTGLLHGAQARIRNLAEKTNAFTAVLATSVIASLIACNQTLTIILTSQLCGGLTEDKSETALMLEDSAVIVSPLVPWSIAGAVPLTTIGCPLTGMLFACYLYLLPICRLIKGKPRKKGA